MKLSVVDTAQDFFLLRTTH